MNVLEEKQLFQLIKDKLIEDLIPTEEFNHLDATSKKTKTGIELKCRREYYRFLMIEKHKYDKLINSSYKNLRYICSVPKGDMFEVFSFDIKKLPEPVWREMWVPQTTDFKSKKWLKKLVGFYDNQQGNNITQLLFN